MSISCSSWVISDICWLACVEAALAGRFRPLGIQAVISWSVVCWGTFSGVGLAVSALSCGAVDVCGAELGGAGVLSVPRAEARLPRFRMVRSSARVRRTMVLFSQRGAAGQSFVPAGCGPKQLAQRAGSAHFSWGL